MDTLWNRKVEYSPDLIQVCAKAYTNFLRAGNTHRIVHNNDFKELPLKINCLFKYGIDTYKA